MSTCVSVPEVCTCMPVNVLYLTSARGSPPTQCWNITMPEFGSHLAQQHNAQGQDLLMFQNPNNKLLYEGVCVCVCLLLVHWGFPVYRFIHIARMCMCVS